MEKRKNHPKIKKKETKEIIILKNKNGDRNK